MSGHTATLAEWAQMLSLSVSLYAAVSAPYFLLVDAECWAWPRPVSAAVERARPVLWDASRSEAVYPLLREWDNARHTVRETGQRAALTVAALFLLFAPSSASEATR